MKEVLRLHVTTIFGRLHGKYLFPGLRPEIIWKCKAVLQIIQAIRMGMTVFAANAFPDTNLESSPSKR